MSNDNETQQTLGEAEALAAMFESSGWQVAERVYNEIIAELKDVTQVPLDEDATQQVRDRINTVANLEAWMAELKGRVHNAQFYNTPTRKKGHVERR